MGRIADRLTELGIELPPVAPPAGSYQPAVRDGDHVFVTAFQGMLCLFLLEMGMTAARKLRDLRSAGRGLIAFGLLAPNLFAAGGVLAGAMRWSEKSGEGIAAASAVRAADAIGDLA